MKKFHDIIKAMEYMCNNNCYIKYDHYMSNDSALFVGHESDVPVNEALGFSSQSYMWLTELFTFKDYVYEVTLNSPSVSATMYFMTPYGVKNIGKLTEPINKTLIDDANGKAIACKLNEMDNDDRRLINDEIGENDIAIYDSKNKTIDFYDYLCDYLTVSNIDPTKLVHLIK